MWRVEDYEELDSTSDLAADRQPWTVVRAQRQRGGRGTHGRRWVSGVGGLWMSAVLPADGVGGNIATLPLLTGMALCEICRELGVRDVRLRWPNDLMIRNLKVAGILLDRPVPEKIVIGIGVNLTQDPSLTMTELKGQAGRLQDFLPMLPDRDTLTMRILEKLAEIHAHDFACFAPRLSACWGVPRMVEVEVDRRLITGLFTGVDNQGNPILRLSAGERIPLSGPHIWKLREI
ncbi:MAG: biotin--[acetyl-CoA-carboxylase] ligase [Verrucomicrobiales bacterium]|jgi:BirA family biotin operon repressor/biotin-[acetyl-CoA-carboxylase] ligase|nr:biotin--[acetyl-CoA-carboxylase] ligase [Verrucomicrobiales bacterium]